MHYERKSWKPDWADHASTRVFCPLLHVQSWRKATVAGTRLSRSSPTKFELSHKPLKELFIANPKPRCSKHSVTGSNIWESKLKLSR